MGDQRLFASMRRTAAQSGSIGAVLAHPIFGEVAAATGQVDAAVLPKINQLQGGTDRIALCQCRRIAHAVEVQQQAPHRVSGAAAVVQQLRLVRVAGLPGRHVDVLDKGVQQGVQQVQREVVAHQDRVQRGENPGPFAVGMGWTEGGLNELLAVTA